MSEQILFVDDEPNVLASITRHLRRSFNVTTQESANEALRLISEGQEFAVIVSDMRMPEMDGIKFLSKAREISPDSVRMMLTGAAELETTVSAVNEGNIFRFLMKPCPPKELMTAVRSGIKQYRLIRTEKELLEKTLIQSIEVLTEVLSLVNPTAFGRTVRIRALVSQMASRMEEGVNWQLEAAAMVSQIGCVILPQDILNKAYSGAKLTENEKQMMSSQLKVGYELIAKIPRMEEVARIISYQEHRFDGSGQGSLELKGKALPMGARILKVALDFDSYVSAGQSESSALIGIKANANWYDPDVITALSAIISESLGANRAAVEADKLEVGMVFADDLLSGNGALLAAKGTRVTSSLLERLRNWIPIGGIREPIIVLLKPE